MIEINDDETASRIYTEIDNATGDERMQMADALGKYGEKKLQEEYNTNDEHYSKMFMDDAYNQEYKGRSTAIKEAVNPDETWQRGTIQGYLSHRLGRDVTADNYEIERDAFSISAFGQKNINDGQLFDNIKGDYEWQNKKTEALNDLHMQSVGKAINDSQLGQNRPFVDGMTDIFNQWQQKYPELVDGTNDAAFLSQGYKLYYDTINDLDSVRPQAAQTLSTLEKFTKGESDPESLQTLSNTLIGATPEERQKIYKYVTLAAEAGHIDRAGLDQFAINMGQSFTRGFDFIPQGSLQIQEAGVNDVLQKVKSGQKVLVPQNGDITKATVAEQTPKAQVLSQAPTAGMFATLQDGYREATPEEADQFTSYATNAMESFKVVRELRNVAKTGVDPIRPVLEENSFWGTAERGAYGLAGSIPLMGATAVNPFLGALAYQATEYDRIMLENPDIKPQFAQGLALVEGVANAATDRLQIANISGRLPMFGRYLDKIASNGVRRTAKIGGAIAFENLQEAGQDLIAPLLEAPIAALRDDMPDQDFGKLISDWAGQRPETFFATLPLALIGGGIASSRDIKHPSAELNATKLRMAGFSPEQTTFIQRAENPEEYDIRIQMEFPNRTPENIQAGEELIQQSISEAQTPPENSAKLEETVAKDGTRMWTVTTPDGKELLTTKDQQAALVAIREHNGAQIINERNTVADMVDYFRAQDPTNEATIEAPRNVQQELDRLTESGDYKGIVNLSERIRFAGIPEDADLTSYNILGEANVETTAEGVFRGVIKLRENSRPEDAFEEINHVFVRKALAEGRTDLDSLRGWLNQTSEATGQTYAAETETDIIENIAKVGMDYAAGRIEETSLPASFVDYIKRMLQVFKETMARALKLNAAFAEGKIDANFESFLADSVGLNQQARVDTASQRVASDVLADTDGKVVFSRAQAQSNAGEIRASNATITGPANYSIAAHHGTPHKVDKFSTAKIGTGEGAQAYGWGLYFAQNKGVAEDYQDRLTNDSLILDGVSAMQKRTETGNQIWGHASQYFADGAKTKKQLLAKLQSARDFEKARGNKYFSDEKYAEVENAISQTNEIAKGNEGNLYTAEIDVEPEDLLDWDKPISEQSPKVKAALEPILSKLGSSRYQIEIKPASAFYAGLSSSERGAFFSVKSPKAASEALLAAGIPGIRYLDGSSRSEGIGTYNYVAFDENLIKITEENGNRIPASQALAAPAPGVAVENGRAYSPMVRDLLQRRAAGENIPRSVIDQAISDNFPAQLVEPPKSESDLPTRATIDDAINDGQRRDQIAKSNIQPGESVTIRQDVPAMTRKGVGVVTIKGKSGNSYDAAARISNPQFILNEKKSLEIGMGGAKGPHIAIRGKWSSDQSMPPDLNQWTQVGFNPDRHSFYYDRATMKQVVGGSEAYQIGNTVFVKDAQFGDGQISNISYSIGKNYSNEEKYNQIVPEISSVNPNKVSRRDMYEVAKVSTDVAANMSFEKPIEISLFADGTLMLSDGHHRLAAAKQLGMNSIPAVVRSINAKGNHINALIAEQQPSATNYSIGKKDKEVVVDPDETTDPGTPAPDTGVEILNPDREGEDIPWGPTNYSIGPRSLPEVFPTIDKKLFNKIKKETSTIAAIHIDRMKVGELIGIPLQGGMFYPSIVENLKAGVVWAFNAPNVARTVARRAAANGGYVKLVLMQEGNVIGNKTFSHVWFANLEQNISNGAITKATALGELNRVRELFANHSDSKLSTGHKKKWKSLEEAKEAIISLPQQKRASTYFQKTKVKTKGEGVKIAYQQLLSKKNTKLGMPDTITLVEQMEEPAFKGMPTGAIVGIIKIDPIKDSDPILTGQQAGVPTHLSYNYVLKGKPVAKMKKITVLDEAFPETKGQILTQQHTDFPLAGAINYSIASQSEIDRVNKALGGMNRGPDERLKVYQRAKNSFSRVMQENKEALDAIRSSVSTDTAPATERVEMDRAGKMADVSSEEKTELEKALQDNADTFLPRIEAAQTPSERKKAERDAKDRAKILEQGIRDKFAERKKSVDAEAKSQRDQIVQAAAAKDSASNARMRDKVRNTKLVNAIGELDGILKALPPEVRGRVGGFAVLANIGTGDKALADFFVQRIDMIDRQLERTLKEEYGTQFDALLERTKPKKAKAGEKPKGIGADIQSLFSAVREARAWNPDKVDGHIADLETQIAAGNLTPEEEAWLTREADLVSLAGDWKNADSSRRAAALEASTETWAKGIYEFVQKKIQEREARDIARAKAIKATGKKGDYPDRRARSEADNGLKGKSHGWLMDTMSWDQVAGIVFGHESAIAIELSDGQRKAEYAKIDAVQAKEDAIHDLFTQLAGGSRLDGEKLMWKMSQPSIDAGGLNLSQLEALSPTMLWAQEDGRRHMIGQLDETGIPTSRWHYNQQFIDDIESQLSPEAKAVRDFLWDSYGKGWFSINAVYRDLNGISLPRIFKYSPVTVNPINVPAGMVSDPVTGNAVSAGSISPGALRTRGTAIAQPNFRNVISTYIAHTRQMEHWKAFAPWTKEANGILRNRDVQDSIHEAGGEEANKVLNRFLDAFAQGGNRDASLGLEISQTLSRMTSRAAQVALVGRVGTLAIQFTQIGAASAELPMGAYVSRLGKLMTGNLSWAEALNSPYIQRRIKQMPPSVQIAMEGLKAGKPNQLKHQVTKVGQLISGSDALWTAGTYAMVYDYHLGQAKSFGYTGQAAEEYAHNTAERVTDRLAQPTRMGTRSIYEITSTNPGSKLGWAFASEARKNIALLAYTKANRSKGQYRTAVLGFVLFNLAMGAFIRNAWKDMKDDDDDELFDDKTWNWKRIGVAMLTEPLQGIPYLGDYIEKGINAALGQYHQSSDLISFERGVRAIKHIPDILDGERDMEGVLKDIDGMVSLMGMFNQSAAAAASLTHIASDFFGVAKNATTED